MTIQELINKLEEIKDKNRTVYIENNSSDFGCNDYVISEANKVIDSTHDNAYDEGIYIVGK